MLSSRIYVFITDCIIVVEKIKKKRKRKRKKKKKKEKKKEKRKTKRKTKRKRKRKKKKKKKTKEKETGSSTCFTSIDIAHSLLNSSLTYNKKTCVIYHILCVYIRKSCHILITDSAETAIHVYFYFLYVFNLFMFKKRD